MKTRGQFEEQTAGVLQDAANKLSDLDRRRALDQAIAQGYSKDRPLEKVEDLAGAGTHDVTLPTAWEDGFSTARSVEYPPGNVPPTLIEECDWTIYRAPGGLKLRLLTNSPAASETVRLTYTARHDVSGSTVPEPDFFAVCDLAAALAFEFLAAIYAQTGDSTIGADTVNYRTKSQEYLGLAKAARRRYCNHLGVEESGSGAAEAGPAVAIGDLEQPMGWGGDRLTHPRPR